MSEAFGQDRSGRCGEPEGALEEALRRTVGRPAEPRAGLDPVNVTMIRQWCEAFDDDNPVYRDPAAAARSIHGRLVAPPAMLDVWLMPGQAPRPETSDHPLARVLPKLDAVGFVGVVATNAEHEYLRYLVIGDEITAHESLEDVSGLKKTALGEGHFVTTVTEYRDARGEPVGNMRWSILKFRPGDLPSGGGFPTAQVEEPMRPPRPGVSRDTRFFWEGIEQGELRIQHCRGCGALRHPPVVRCPDCGSYDLGFRVASGRGHVYSLVEVHHPQFPPFEYPLLAALVELEEGTRLVANLSCVEPEEARIGMPVEAYFEKVDPDLTLPFFRPPRPPRRDAPLSLDQVAVGDTLDPCPVPITPTLIVSGAVATRDFTPVHHDPEFARAQGTPDIFMNIMSTNALCTRYVADWAGPDARITHLRVRLGVPNFPGDTMVLRGTVERAEPTEAGARIEVEVRGSNRLGDHATAHVELELPGRPTGATRTGSGNG
ncbi:MAG: MaoC family dehydratase N-terminal domain-containing protein [Thermoleophilia bacterium]|nr:MaoC family dehydratase N-terminal domain-containing protein [Thermoleophilia bacterium]